MTVSDTNVHAADQLSDQFMSLHDCDGYVVLAVDPETGEADAHGPYEGLAAARRAEQLRRDFDRAELADVLVRIVRLHRPGSDAEPF
ncbi:MAG TPA: hypothetical protein VHH34_04015 [Pseudonocardiaceae bacterium]|nr:hypothetical protein [Pseudonocardiaceae bacterium]